jgi:hypothetical protein
MGDRATAHIEDIWVGVFPGCVAEAGSVYWAGLTDESIGETDVADVNAGDRDLHRGGRHRFGAAAGAGVSVASRTLLPLRRDGHTKVYCGDQKSLCDRTHV